MYCVMHYVMHYSRKGHLVVLVALGTNDSVLVKWGVDKSTIIQPDLVRLQLGGLEIVLPAQRQVASRAHQAIACADLPCGGAYR